MCIAIAIPANKRLPRSTLLRCWETNDDGGGLMYVKNNAIKIAKEFSDFNKFHELYLKHYEKASKENSPMVLHFRIGTHGERSLHNVHPFVVNNDVAFCHNGVLAIKTSGKNSDTRQFNIDYLKRLPIDFYKNSVIMNLLESKIGSNKFIFLSRDKVIYILNEELGTTEDGVWYSNGSFKSSSSCVYPTQHGFAWDDHEDFIDHRAQNRDYFLKKTESTGIDSEERNSLEKTFENLCLMCGEIVLPKLSTAFVTSRGIFCPKCAYGIGLTVDDMRKVS